MIQSKKHLFDPLSLSSVKIEVFRTDFETNEYKLIGPASGFIINRLENYYLITNWHVLTGRNADTNQPICPTGALPSMIRLHLIKELSTTQIQWGSLDIPLPSTSWIEHPNGRNVDVVALLLQPGISFKIYPLDLSLSQIDIAIFPALPISIIGFPLGLKAGGYLPVWLTGSVASEFCVNVENKPLFYANVSGREGLSGSPVVTRAVGSCFTQKENLNLFTGIRTKFLGIYSGRAHDKTEICRVWKAEVIDELNWPLPNKQELINNLTFPKT